MREKTSYVHLVAEKGDMTTTMVELPAPSREYRIKLVWSRSGEAWFKPQRRGWLFWLDLYTGNAQRAVPSRERALDIIRAHRAALNSLPVFESEVSD